MNIHALLAQANMQLHSIRSVHRGAMALLIGISALTGCGGGSDGASGFLGFPAAATKPQASTKPHDGLSYAMTSPDYEVGVHVVAKRPSASGGAVARYTMTPQQNGGAHV